MTHILYYFLGYFLLTTSCNSFIIYKKVNCSLHSLGKMWKISFYLKKKNTKIDSITRKINIWSFGVFFFVFLKQKLVCTKCLCLIYSTGDEWNETNFDKKSWVMRNFNIIIKKNYKMIGMHFRFIVFSLFWIFSEFLYDWDFFYSMGV